jgi:hypothetical protein
MKWLLKLYPPAWRARYEAEMAALLDEQRAGRRGVIDLVRGAADAWIIGPRGPLGGLHVWMAALAYAGASIGIAVAQRVLGDAAPWDTLFQIVFWLLFIIFTTWLAGQPGMRCSLRGTRARR